MKKMRPRTEDDLKALLGIQLDFLKRSADAFDNGLTDEAVRLAVTLRLLLHDTANSKSLLGQLSMKNLSFHDSSVPFDPHSLAPQWGLVFVAFGPKTARYAAKLDGSREVRKTTFSEWWNGIVLSDARKLKITRKDLILVAANQDGGAHVDTSLDETYAAFSKDGALGWKVGTRAGERLIEQPERATIRQIAHEVLKTLIPGYSCKSKAGPEFVISGVSLKAVGPITEKKITSVAASRKIGRNEPCPCGSGKKYKKCCGI